jgi:hypothetical protein
MSEIYESIIGKYRCMQWETNYFCACALSDCMLYRSHAVVVSTYLRTAAVRWKLRHLTDEDVWYCGHSLAYFTSTR